MRIPKALGRSLVGPIAALPLAALVCAILGCVGSGSASRQSGRTPPPRQADVPAPSMGMPQEVFFADEDNGGNCATLVSVDEKGVVTGSRGCETHATMDEPRTLSPEGRARLVAALDRLRSSPVWQEASDERCGEGLTLRLTQRNGPPRSWAYCAKPEQQGVRKVPDEILDVWRALDPPRSSQP